MTSDKQILLGLTTTGTSNWRDKVEEIKQLNLREIALLPTGLNPTDRHTLYKLLENAGLDSIPYVHLRDDFTLDEVEYLVAQFKVKAFSCHADAKGYALLDRLPKYNSIIYVENFTNEEADKMFTAENFAKHQVSGVCLDLAHLEEARRSSQRHYKRILEIIKKYPVKINHLSGVKTSVLFKIFNKTYVDKSLDALADLNYLKQVPASCFGKYIILEMENSFLEQTEIKKFIETIIQ